MLNIGDQVQFLEKVLTAFNMGRLTSKQAQRYIKGLGWTCSLRSKQSFFPAWCPAGTYIELNI